MKLHRGRLLDHVQLMVADLPSTIRFYSALFDVLGIEYAADDKHFGADELWIEQGEPYSHIHIAFQAKDKAQVTAWYEAALMHGGSDNGPPGERKYHPGYYAAFILDPDGNNLEAVYHGPHERSAPSVEISFGEP